MFPPPAQVLRQREGTLAELPLPLLLHALDMEERTCTLELKARQREKRITFEEGAPVACVSHLLHETLGKFLVEKGKLSEAALIVQNGAGYDAFMNAMEAASPSPARKVITV